MISYNTFEQVRGLHYTRQMMMNNTFEPEDIFDNKTLNRFRNTPQIDLKEVDTLFLGRCYTVCNGKMLGVKKVYLVGQDRIG